MAKISSGRVKERGRRSAPSGRAARAGMAVRAGLALGLLLCAGTTGRAQETVRLNIKAAAPADTPEYDVIFISGNSPELGNWNPGLVRLVKKDGVHSLDLEVRAGVPLEYKYTRGNWDTVEKGADFSELANRRFTAQASAGISDTILNWADRKPYLPEQRTVTGTLLYHRDFYSRALKNKRTLAVWLPPSYAASRGRRYPVIYMHDGQNLFDKATAFIGEEWGADEAAAALAAQDPALEAIVVGVYNTGDRLAEYTPHRDGARGGGKGRAYAKFIVKEVKPFIDGAYRTLKDRNNTFTAGSSLGGVISLYLLLEYPKVFSGAGALSPSLYWADGALPALAGRKAAAGKMKIWLSMGTEEGNGSAPDPVEQARELRARLLGKGFVENRDLVYVEAQGARHSEKHWARQVPALFRFLLQPGP